MPNLDHKMPKSELLKWCPFCHHPMKGNAHKCGACVTAEEMSAIDPEAVSRAGSLPAPKWCPICGEPVGENHKC